MKKLIISGVIIWASILTPQITQAQGNMTYLSNLGQTSTGSLAVGSNSWLTTLFSTGTNPGGYTLNSIQLAMTDASGNPSGFTAMLYTVGIGFGPIPGTSLGTLDGSLNPTTAGIYTFTPASNLTLSSQTGYFIVLTAGTEVANGAYDWSYAGTNSYNPSVGWSSLGDVWTSSDGSHWNTTGDSAQFAINATAIPEPGVSGLFGLGGLAFLWHRRKSKAA
jgi:hypothetical protein